MENSATQCDADIFFIYKAPAARNNSHENAAYQQTNHCYVIQFGFLVFSISDSSFDKSQPKFKTCKKFAHNRHLAAEQIVVLMTSLVT